MIIDTSAIIAVMTHEPAAAELIDVMLAADALFVGAPSLAETSIVLQARFQKDVQGLVARFLQEFEIETTAFDAPHWMAAARAYAQYGKGRHPARLNFGDCMTYAVAKLANMPLLFVGDDFAKTDLIAARRPVSESKRSGR